MRMWQNLRSLAFGLALASALAHCGGDAPGSGVPGDAPGQDDAGSADAVGPADHPSILLVVLDTVRADHLTCYGYDRPTTPRICAAAEGGILFEQAFANSSWTLPSHASLFTGLYGAGHRATQETLALPDGPPTLAELLAAAGYDTWAASANPMVSATTGMERGFTEFVENWRDENRAVYPDHPNNLAFGAYLDRLDDERPFFAFINYIEAHTYYQPPPEIARRFLAPDRTREEIAVNSRRTMDDHYLRGPLTPRQLAVVGELYDGELAFLDDLIADLLERLGASGRDRDTLVVITSDHGEHLGEHGHFQHVFSLSDILVRVPLMILLPDGSRAGTVRRDPVQLLDLFPTLLAWAGVPLPDDRYAILREGRDILAEAPAEPPAGLMAEYYYPRQVLSAIPPPELSAGRRELAPYLRRLRSLRQGDLKLVWGSDGRHELYDMSADPDESANLIDSPALATDRERMLAALREQVRRVMGEPPLDPPPPPGWLMPGFDESRLDEETRQRLRSLGYID